MAYEKDPDELGALWLKSGAKGEYLTGEISGVKVVCLKVTAKSEKSPTWRVLKSKPRDEEAPRTNVTSQDVPF
jgi:hypothetical protein